MTAAPGPLSPADFAAAANVSRETMVRLEGYDALLGKWQKAINLVARDSLGDLWRRHMLDSAVLWPLIPKNSKVLVDLGSGAGFPGLVLAILGMPQVHLIESDGRKCAFLTEVARLFSPNPVKIHHGRIESVESVAADVVTARALADLDTLLTYSGRFLRPDGVCLFPKGKTAEDDLTLASQRWTMRVERFANPAESSGIILRIKGLHR